MKREGYEIQLRPAAHQALLAAVVFFAGGRRQEYQAAGEPGPTFHRDATGFRPRWDSWSTPT